MFFPFIRGQKTLMAMDAGFVEEMRSGDEDFVRSAGSIAHQVKTYAARNPIADANETLAMSSFLWPDNRADLGGLRRIAVTFVPFS